MQRFPRRINYILEEAKSRNQKTFPQVEKCIVMVFIKSYFNKHFFLLKSTVWSIVFLHSTFQYGCLHYTLFRLLRMHTRKAGLLMLSLMLALRMLKKRMLRLWALGNWTLRLWIFGRSDSGCLDPRYLDSGRLES